MDRFESLKKNEDFARIYRSGKSYGNRLFAMYVFPGEQGQGGRVGVSVSKKVGNSVVRHRIRRLVKECFRLHISKWSGAVDIIVVARREAKDKSFVEVEKALLHLGKKSGAYQDLGEEE